MPTSQPLMRTLIIDDEQHARHYLRELLGVEKDVVVLGEDVYKRQPRLE